MNRALVPAVILFLGACPVVSAEDYGWSLSFSNTDPYVNVGQDPPPGPVDVYLWLTCSIPGLPHPGGASAAEFDLATTNWSVLGFAPAAGILNAGSPTALLLAIGGCPQGPAVAGTFTLFDTAGEGGDACLVPSAMNGLNVTVDCDPINPQLHPNSILGVTTLADPCWVGICIVESVRDASWGAIKGLYR